MIDPSKISNFNLNDAELEENILFWICAAGKNGRVAARCLNNLLNDLKIYFSYKFWPFELIRKTHEYSGDLPTWLKTSGIGCYTHKARTFAELVYSGINLRMCTAEDLEKIYGIGMKTSRCFIIHTRKGARYAGLDTHILKYLKYMGVENVPKSTPGKKEYLRLEREFLKIADSLKKEPYALDLEVWNAYSTK